jgi:uncharacterized protein YecE (DUF72 family)
MILRPFASFSGSGSVSHVPHVSHPLPQYASGYEDASLERWAARMRAWADEGDVYCYFDNDIKVRAPFDAKRLMEMVGWTARPSTRSTGL